MALPGVRSCVAFGRRMRSALPCGTQPACPHTGYFRRLCSRSSTDASSHSPPKSKGLGWKWVPIPIGVGFALVGYQQWSRIVDRERRKQGIVVPPRLAKEWQVSLYRKMPLRAMSRAWGKVNNIDLPVWLRRPVLGLYAWAFRCNLDEAAVADLEHYRNLGEFFRRSLKVSARPVDRHSPLVLPSDGKVLHYGTVEDDVVEQVKGVTYSLEGFFGPDVPAEPSDQPTADAVNVDSTRTQSGDYSQKLLHNPDKNKLYHCVIYLAPGDYHRFHSPADWTVTRRRHFPGELLSVNPSVARWVQGLFSFNERAVYSGTWKHGFFSMTAVGATNVGSIKIYFDRDLQTNVKGKMRNLLATCHERSFALSADRGDSGIELRRGESFGEFNLGSTVVLIFEAPKDFKFAISEGKQVMVGQPLGGCTAASASAAAAADGVAANGSTSDGCGCSASR